MSHPPHEPPTPTTHDSGFSIENLIEGLIFRSRWILAVFYLLLVASLFLFAGQFILSFLHFAGAVIQQSISQTDVLIEILHLVDMTLLANLILIVIFSGYENFVSVIGMAQDSPDRPKWMGEVDFSGLKLKLIGSMVALSGISLLGAFLNMGSHELNQTQLAWMVGIHFTFVVTGVFYALTEYLGHRH